MFPPPPLTREELNAIQKRNRSEDMRAVLWDLFRLRALVRRMWHAFNAMEDSNDLTSKNRFTRQTLRELRADVNEEPVVDEAKKEMRRSLDENRRRSPDFKTLWTSRPPPDKQG